MARMMGIWERMDTGQRVSGVAHLGLIAWIMLGTIFQPRNASLTIPVSDVSIISAEEFAALSGPRPDPAPPAPEPTPAPEPAPAPEPTPAPTPVTPAPPPAPEPEIRAPDPVAPPPPVSEAAPAPTPAPAEQSSGVVFSPLPAPGVSARPRPRPVERVAPTPTEAPPETAQIDIAAQPAAQAQPEAETPLPERDQAETAPPEATTEIVTEATETDDGSLERAAMAPNLSQRPRTRPDRPAQAPEPPTQTATAPTPPTPPTQTAPTPPTPPTPPTAPTPPTPAPAPAPAEPPSDAIAEALAAALSEQLTGGGGTPGPSAGAALSASEADALRLAIQACWNVGVLSTDAQQVTVTVAFSMTPSARHEQGSIRMVSASGGSETAVQQAFEAARRAIIRCEGDGYGLPPEKYDAWRDIEITFNPEGMRLR